MLTDRNPMIHLGDDDLNPSQQISSSKATAMKSRWHWCGDKKRPANIFLDCSNRGFEGIKWWAWQIFTFTNTEKVFHTSRSSFLRLVLWLWEMMCGCTRISDTPYEAPSTNGSSSWIYYLSIELYFVIFTPLVKPQNTKSIFCTAVHQKRENVLPYPIS